MSAALMGRATWLAGVSCPEKMVLVAIADVADDTGLAYMLIETLMAKSSLSRRTVQSTLCALSDKGLLLKRTRRNRSSIFKIEVSQLPVGRPSAISEKELSDDHFWDGARGAALAPLGRAADRENAGDADESAGDADENAGAAPIHPVEHPVEHPVLTPLPPDGSLFGGPLEEDCPPLNDDEVVAAFVDRWNALADEVERFERINRFGGQRRASLLARVEEYARARGAAEVAALFDRVIATVRGSKFLRGEKKAFKATPDWMVLPTWFPKLEETGYVQDAAPGAGYEPDAGHRSHVAAGREARDILRAGGGTPRRSARQLAGLAS